MLESELLYLLRTESKSITKNCSNFLIVNPTPPFLSNAIIGPGMGGWGELKCVKETSARVDSRNMNIYKKEAV